MKKLSVLVLILAIILTASACTCTGGEKETVSTDSASDTGASSTVSSTKSEPGQTVTSIECPLFTSSTASAVSRQEEALQRAIEYISEDPARYNYNNMVTVLQKDGFSHQDAAYAAQASGAGRISGAINYAKRLLDHDGISRFNMIDALVKYGYTQEEATMAADHCGADWNEQAVKLVLYDHETLFSPRQTVIDKLKDKNYTLAQIDYAMTKCAQQVKENPVKRAKVFMEGYSPDIPDYITIVSRLTVLYHFTDEEAEYGASNCGIDWNKKALDYVVELVRETPLSHEFAFKYMYQFFSEAQIKYADDNCNIDWNEQAVLAAINYNSQIPMSKSEMYQLLLNVGFTEAQAKHGSENY